MSACFSALSSAVHRLLELAEAIPWGCELAHMAIGLFWLPAMVRSLILKLHYSKWR
jgi:hypothetical protein